jgi:hypothetical protein
MGKKEGRGEAHNMFVVTIRTNSLNIYYPVLFAEVYKICSW